MYIAGLVVGNAKIVHKKSMGTFFDGFAWLWQIVMFLTLGLLVNPHELLPVAPVGLFSGSIYDTDSSSSNDFPVFASI